MVNIPKSQAAYRSENALAALKGGLTSTQLLAVANAQAILAVVEAINANTAALHATLEYHLKKDAT